MTPKKYVIKDGGIIPPWVAENQPPPSDVPHPYKTFTDRIVLKNPKRLELSSHYIHTVERGQTPESDDFILHANRAKEKRMAGLYFGSGSQPPMVCPQSPCETA